MIMVRDARARLLVVWCPDWPVVAACLTDGIPVQSPVAVLHANEVTASSAAARARGVRRGLRRREAQYRCPELVVTAADRGRDVRTFERVAAAVERLAPGIEVVRPGVVAVPVRGPARAFGGEQAAAERMIEHVATEAGVECQVGIADGVFAAFHAARAGRIVPPGGNATFLAPLPITELTTQLGSVGSRDEKARAELADLLRRLGIRTLGQFAALPERQVHTRFGADALEVHRLAAGVWRRPPVRRRVPPELVVSQDFDPPLDDVSAAAFAARGLGHRLYDELTRRDLACSRLTVHARTAHGEHLSRVWRCTDPLTADGITDRMRWQLEGWLRAPGSAPTAGLCSITVEPAETVGGQALQAGLWRGGADEVAAERAGRALERAQALLGTSAVCTPVLCGGRSAAARIQLVPWGDERVPDSDPRQPWPGRLPAPSPATLPAPGTAVAVLDERGAPVAVDGRQRLSAQPYYVVPENARPKTVHGWSGPWPIVEQWWSPSRATRVARLQVVCGDDDTGTDPDIPQQALLLQCRGGRWSIEGVYD